MQLVFSHKNFLTAFVPDRIKSQGQFPFSIIKDTTLRKTKLGHSLVSHAFFVHKLIHYE